jgi:hypothetical protein
MTVVDELIKGTRDARRAKYLTCAFCGRTNPPELMADETTCVSCAEHEMNVIH